MIVFVTRSCPDATCFADDVGGFCTWFELKPSLTALWARMARAEHVPARGEVVVWTRLTNTAVSSATRSGSIVPGFTPVARARFQTGRSTRITLDSLKIIVYYLIQSFGQINFGYSFGIILILNYRGVRIIFMIIYKFCTNNNNNNNNNNKIAYLHVTKV